MSDDPPPLSETDRIRFGENPTESFRLNLADVQRRIAAACARAGRCPTTVRLLPITKTVPAPILRMAHAAGIASMGENKIQEALGKEEALRDLPIAWSIVGHLQTNKVKYLARFAAEFHALDSLKLAESLNRRLELEERTLDVFVQVNTSGEASKFGLHPDETAAFIERMPAYPRLKVRGLMTLAVFSADMERVRPCFRILNRLLETLRTTLPAARGMDQLSMGMSGDFEAAIEEGATVVRVGQAIFGARPGSDTHYWPGLIPEGYAR